MSKPDSTASDVRPVADGPAPAWGRRVVVAVLALIVIAGALGVFGVHSRTVRTTANGYTLTVTYPQTARAGLDVPWRVHVHHPGGFPAQIVIAVSTDYFRMFETQGFFPDADSVSNDGRFVYFTFDTVPGSSDFSVDYDAYIQPAAQIGKSAIVKLVVGKHIQAQTSLHTWLVP